MVQFYQCSDLAGTGIKFTPKYIMQDHILVIIILAPAWIARLLYTVCMYVCLSMSVYLSFCLYACLSVFQARAYISVGVRACVLVVAKTHNLCL
jgi:hypothetical protein